MEVAVDWVKPEVTSGGLDPLGTQQPCILIYGNLLPGITNVTDRISYYSFYPWFLRAWDRRRSKGDRLVSSLKRDLRRAECLLTLISLQHAYDAEGDPNSAAHSGVMVGINTLGEVQRRIADGKPVALPDYATLEAVPERYFKNQLGGFGQYYAGPLDELGIIARARAGGLSYTEDRASALADAVEESLPADEFMRALGNDAVELEDLRALAAFCPCHIARPGSEQDGLRDIALARGTYEAGSMLARRNTLGLLLHLASSLGQDGPLNREVFCGSSLTGHLPSGLPWQLPEKLVSTRKGWAYYQQNEIYSLAYNTVFWCALWEAWQADFTAPNVEEFACWVSAQKVAEEVLDLLGQQTETNPDAAIFGEVLGSIRNTAPNNADWSDPAHEFALTAANLRLFVPDRPPSNDELVGAMVRALRSLLTLAVHRDGSNPYTSVGVSLQQIALYPLNLRQFRPDVEDRWSNLPLKEWIVDIVRVAVDTHLRIALRKLRQGGKDTFRIKPTIDGLRVVREPIPPAPTNPRFTQARRVLQDLGLLESDVSCKLTESGTRELNWLIA